MTVKRLLVAVALGLPAVAALPPGPAAAQHITPNHASSVLGVAHAVGDGQLRLTAGKGALFGSPTPASPVRVVAVRDLGLTETLLAILDATGRTGDTLTGVVSAGETYNGAVLNDVALPAGTVIEARLTDGLMAETRASAGNGNVRSGTAWYDVSQWGATAGSTTATANVALAAAKADATARGIAKGTFYIPTGDASTPYYYTNTLKLPNGWDVAGAGADKSFLTSVPNWDTSAVAVGLRDSQGPPLTNHWQPLAGVADAGWANGRSGFRTATAGGSPANSDYAQIQLQPGSLAYGPLYDGYAATNKLTIEALLQGYLVTTGSQTAAVPGPVPPGFCFGLATDQGAPSPYFVVFEGGSGTFVSGTGTTPTVNVPQIRFEAITGGGPGYVAFTSGVLAGQVFEATAGTNPTGDNYALTLAGALPQAPTAGDGCVYYTGVSLHCRLATGLLNGVAGQYDPSYGGGTVVATWRLPAGQGAAIAQPQRWVWQFDATGTTNANAAQAAASCGTAAPTSMAWLTTAGISGGGAPFANPALMENGYVPFVVGSLGPGELNEAAIPYPKTEAAATTAGGMDCLVGGLSVCAGTAGGNVYSVGTAGTAPALNPSGPRPSGAINDSFRYNLTGVATAAGSLSMDTTFADASAGGFARWHGAFGTVGGWVKQDTGSSGFQLAGTVRDLTITSSGQHSGNGVEIGGAVGQTIRDLHILGFANSVGSAPSTANYPHKIVNLVSDFPSQAAIYGYKCVMWADKLVATSGKRSVVRMAGCDLKLRSCYSGATTGSAALKHHAVDLTGSWLIEDFTWDSEGAPMPAVALIDFESPGSAYTQLTVRNSSLGNIGVNAAFVRLRGGGTKPVLVSIRDNTWGYKQGGPYAFCTVDNDVGFSGLIENTRPTSGWDLTQPTIPMKSFAVSGLSGVRAVVETPGVALPPVAVTSAPGTIVRNYKAPATGSHTDYVLGTDAAWHAMVTLP